MKRSATYIWQHDEWPNMHFDHSAISSLLAEVNRMRGELSGRISMFGFEEQNISALESLTSEIVHSAKIEGQELNRDSVRSSLALHLGLPQVGLPVPDHYTEGIVQVMMDAVNGRARSLTDERLFSWHAALFPTGRSGIYEITVGNWRQGDEPMQVVSGPLGRQKVHYEAPPSNVVPEMMGQFICWINSADDVDPVVKAAVAHLWFVTIHPFDDGNGRLCRTLTEMLLARADNASQRYYSLSSEILNHRKDYYEHLEQAQKGTPDVTPWIAWFLSAMKGALKTALARTESVVRKMHFWERHRLTPLNERQRKVINLLFDGFEGVLNSSKWYKINHCSQDTAIRDINDLLQKGILRQTEGRGRNTSYELASAE